MLIDKGVSVGEVCTFRLSSGEEVIAKLTGETEKDYKVSKPMVLSMNAQGIGMIPFLFTVDMEKDIKINRVSIITVENTEKRFADQYIQNTTGIAV
jgi:hypothetical protein